MELEFKVWDKIKKKMVDLANMNFDPTGPLSHIILWDDDDKCYDLGVGSFKLRQYTGLKDKNGTKIFEGDLILCPVTGNKDYHGDFCTNEVIKINGQFVMSHVSSDKGKLPKGYTRGFLLDFFEFDLKLFLWADDYKAHTEIEVIGNIYENPDLLKGDK